MQNREDKAIVTVVSALMITGMVLTPIAGIWPAIAIGGGLWAANKCVDTVNKLTR